MPDPRAALPAVAVVLDRLGERARLRPGPLASLVRDVVEDLRRELAQAGQAGDALAPAGQVEPADLLERAVALVLARQATLLAPPGPAVNATGVLLHTGLGRAPLSPGARRAVAAATDAHTVELDDTGGRGHRDRRLASLVRLLTGAQDTTFANNGAGALVLALRSAAGRGRVAVSRGELIEIGGSFRLPDVIRAAGLELFEIGTTNRTHLADVDEALATGVDAVLVVHPSNYEVRGFATSPDLGDVVGRAHRADVPVVHDVGSGLLEPSGRPGLRDEPAVRSSLAAGVDLVVASGDKLLGGPQAGLVMGRPELVRRARSDALARALRLDKLRIAGLVATLQDHLVGAELPIDEFLAADVADLADRAADLVRRLADHGVRTEAVTTTALVGGGSVPGAQLASVAIALPLVARDPLLAGRPPVVTRVREDRCLVDLRAVSAAADDVLVDAIVAACGTTTAG